MPIQEDPKLTSPPVLIKPRKVADLLGLSEDTLTIWRCTKRYDLPYVRVGKSIMYDLRDVVSFIERRKVRQRRPK